MTSLDQPRDQFLRRSLFWAFAVGMTVWLVFAFVVGPTLVRSAYEGNGMAYLANMMKNRETNTLEHYLGYWYQFVGVGTVVLVGLGIYGYALLDARFFARCVGKQSAQRLGFVRMVVCSCLLASALWEHIPSTALLPREMLHPVGSLRFLLNLPGVEGMLESYSALQVYQWTTIVILVCATIGLGTRISVPLGTILYFILVGILRSYSWPYHTGILSMYAGMTLAFTPCGAAWSADALVRRWRCNPTVDPVKKTETFGWACYLVFVMIALALAAAGLSKVRNGGLSWLYADNFRTILYATTLTPMQFDFGLALSLRDAPDWVFVTMAFTGIAVQLSCLLMLFSKWARWILPVLLVGMHLNIWFLQNILFFEVIVMMLVFYDFGRWQQWLRERFARVSPAEETLQLTSRIRLIAATYAIVWLLMLVWLAKFEFYPLTAMQMFSRPSLQHWVAFNKVFAHYDDGTTERAPLEECIPAFRDSRYRGMFKDAFREDNRISQAYFRVCIEQYNLKRTDRKIESIEVQQWRWNYDDPPVDGTYGFLIDRRVFRPADEGEEDPEPPLQSTATNLNQADPQQR